MEPVDSVLNVFWQATDGPHQAQSVQPKYAERLARNGRSASGFRVIVEGAFMNAFGTIRIDDRPQPAWDNRPAVESFFHLADCPLAGKVCQGTACFVARHLNPHRWADAEEQNPRVSCLGQCFAAPAIADGNTGDGVNDAPALKKVDIGIAMGPCGTDVARESADMILLDGNFASIVAAIEEGRAVYANIRKFLTYILTSNIPEIVPYLAFVLFRIPLPLTIIQILAVDLGTDMVPALALGAEAPNPHTMKQPPRPASERLLNFALIARAYLWLGPMQAVAAMAAFFFVLHRGDWSYGEILAPNRPLYLQATTACLSAIIVMQAVNVSLCRNHRESVFKFGLFSNPLILWGILAELTLILLIDYTPWGNEIFGTAPIPLAVWLFAVPFALALLLLEEGRKWIVRAKGSEVNRHMKAGEASTDVLTPATMSHHAHTKI